MAHPDLNTVLRYTASHFWDMRDDRHVAGNHPTEEEYINHVMSRTIGLPEGQYKAIRPLGSGADGTTGLWLQHVCRRPSGRHLDLSDFSG